MGLMVRVPVGARAMLFVREHYVRLETGDRTVLQRWPYLVLQDDAVEIPEDWPGESNLNHFGQPELGVLTAFDPRYLGTGYLALRVRPPFGTDELYPMSSRAMPFVVEWQRDPLAVGPVSLVARVGYETTLDSSGDIFDTVAFPDGWRYAVSLGVSPRSAVGGTVGWSARELNEGRHERRLNAEAWFTVGDGHRVRFTLTRDMGGLAHRYADWFAGVAWEFRAFVGDEPTADP